MDYAALPKIELHLHLDCSLSFKVVQQLNPSISYEYYQKNFIAPSKCSHLADYLTRAIKGIELMQTKEQLRLVTLDLFEQLKAENVIYAEIRFSPLLHLEKGLSQQDVVNEVNRAVEDGITETGVEAGLILCTLRHYSAQQSMAVIQLVEKFRGTHVVGFDIAGDEAGFPIDNHIRAFSYARSKGIRCTAHAGEAKGADSVRETLQYFHPSRIGHGVRCVEDPQLIHFLKKENIHLEVCLTSNVQTNVIDKVEDHPAGIIYQAGVSMSINTDARTISNISLDSEYQTLEQVFEWKKEHFLKCNLEAIEHAFTSEAKKAVLREKIMQAYS